MLIAVEGGEGEAEGESGGGESGVGKLVLVTDMKRPRACIREESDQTGLSGPREETVSSRRCRSLDLSGQWRKACSSVSGAEAQRGHVVSRFSLNQEGWAAK